jgi:hypothetical protein
MWSYFVFWAGITYSALISGELDNPNRAAGKLNSVQYDQAMKGQNIARPAYVLINPCRLHPDCAAANELRVFPFNACTRMSK